MADDKPTELLALAPAQTVEGLARMAEARRAAGIGLGALERASLAEFPHPRLAVDEPAGPAFASRPGRPADQAPPMYVDDPDQVDAGARIVPAAGGWVADSAHG